MQETDKLIEIQKPHSNRFWYKSIVIWWNERSTKWNSEANSNYKENRSSCFRSNSSTQIFLRKSKKFPDSKSNQDMQRFRIYERSILRIIDANKKNLRLSGFDFEKKTAYNNFEKLRIKGIIICKIGSCRKSWLTNDLKIKIIQILSDECYLDVSKIKDELCEQGIEVNQRT